MLWNFKIKQNLTEQMRLGTLTRFKSNTSYMAQDKIGSEKVALKLDIKQLVFTLDYGQDFYDLEIT